MWLRTTVNAEAAGTLSAATSAQPASSGARRRPDAVAAPVTAAAAAASAAVVAQLGERTIVLAAMATMPAPAARPTPATRHCVARAASHATPMPRVAAMAGSTASR